MTTNILFVDDEACVLRGLKRSLWEMKDQWNMQFVTSGFEALEYMAKNPVDVIVSDMRMPSMNGAILLGQVKQQFPSVVRLILSGYADEEMVVRAVNTAHRYLSKPCDPVLLRATIDRTIALRTSLKSPRLRALVGEIGTLPSPPEMQQRMNERLARTQCNLDQVAAVVTEDPAMSAKVLQLVNSSFFGLGREVVDIADAVKMLGLDLLQTLVLSVNIFEEFQEESQIIQGVATHSMRTASIMRQIMTNYVDDSTMVSAAISGAMLHDVGQLMLVRRDGAKYREIIDEAHNGMGTLIELEEEAFGADHAKLGAYLMALWNLPDPVVEAVAYHHTPSACADSELSPLSFVHLADAIDHSQENIGPIGAPLDVIYLEHVGLQQAVYEYFPAAKRPATKPHHEEKIVTARRAV